MSEAWRPIALGVFVVAVLAAAVALILSFGTDDSSRMEPITVERAQPQAKRAAPERPAKSGERTGDTDRTGTRPLALEQSGNPIVWVRSEEQATIHSSPGGPVVETIGDETDWGSRTIFAVFERRGDWAGVPNPYTGNGNLGWVKLDARRLNAGYTLREIVVDLSEFRAQLLIDGEVERTFTVAVGAPGTSTPTGRFAVTDTFRGDLNPAYGCCAVALTAVQPNLPSGWFGGNRIAIHGTSGPLGVPISSGCVRAADRDVSALVNEVPPGAPVLVRQ